MRNGRDEATGRGRERPACGGYAVEEPGGIRCIVGGHLFLHRRVLPREHWLSGRDWRGRERQLTLDRCFMRSGRVPEFVHDLLERLERRSPKAEVPVATAATPA